MSKVNVNTIEPSTGTDITLGASGDTITVPSGATIANSGTATGFGVSLANGADNRVVTSSSTTALNGEANLTFDGSTFTATGTSSLDGAVVINETGADLDFRVEGDTDANMIYGDASSNNVGIGYATPQGKLHIYRGASGQGSVDANSDELVLENSGHTGMTILSGTSSSGYIVWGDSGNNAIGRIFYNHPSNYMRFDTNASEAMRIDTNGYLLMDKTTSDTAVVGTELHGSQIIVTRANAYASYIARKNGADGTVVQFLRDATEVGSISVNSSATGYNTSSDYRLKENVNYDFDATTRLKELKPAKFNWISDPSSQIVDGFLAHEVSSIVPEAIVGTKDETETKEKVVISSDGKIDAEWIEEADWIKGKEDNTYENDTTWEATKVVPKYQAIDQSKLVPLLVKTIQELEARIKTLEDA